MSRVINQKKFSHLTILGVIAQAMSMLVGRAQSAGILNKLSIISVQYSCIGAVGIECQEVDVITGGIKIIILGERRGQIYSQSESRSEGWRESHRRYGGWSWSEC